MAARMLMCSVVVLVVVIDDATTQPANKDKENLQGTWQAVRLEADGDTGPKEVTNKVKWIFKGEEYTGVSPEMDFKGKFMIKATQKLKEMDLIPTGSKLTRHAIYKLDGDELTICIGKTRPTEFVTTSGSDRRMYILKRAKD